MQIQDITLNIDKTYLCIVLLAIYILFTIFSYNYVCSDESNKELWSYYICKLTGY